MERLPNYMVLGQCNSSVALLHILPLRHFIRVMRRHDLMTIFDDTFWWQFLMTIFDDNFWWQFLMTIFEDNFWWQCLSTIFVNNFWWKFLMTPFDDNFQWQLRTWIQTIILTWQLIVTLDSIRNSCDVFGHLLITLIKCLKGHKDHFKENIARIANAVQCHN